MNTRKKAIVIDDDILVRRVIVSVLSERNIDSLEISNGYDAERVIREDGSNFVLAIVDLVLPGCRTGWEIIDIIRNNADTSKMPIIVVTGAPISGEEITRLKEKVDFVVLKNDFDIDKFTVILDKVLKEDEKCDLVIL